MDIDRPDFSIVFHVMLPWCLLNTHQNPNNVRRLLGKLTKQHGREALLIAFDKTLEAKPRPVDPYTYFIALVQRSNGKYHTESAAELARREIIDRRSR